MKNDATMNVDITASGTNARAEISGVHRAIQDLAGGPVVQLQHGFHTAAGELSALAGVYTGNRLSGVTTQITELAEAVGKIPGPVGLAIGSVAGLGLIALEVGKHLFEMAEKASEMGERLYQAQQITGFSALTLSTLSIAAEHSGLSLEQVTKGTEKFARLMGEAADGSDKAKEALKRLGVESKDLDEGLQEAIKTIGNAKTGLDEVNLAQAAFGARNGPEMIRVIEQMNGSLEKASEEAEKFGTVLTQSDLAASHDFHESLGLLEAQLTTLSAKFALAFAPAVTEAMKGISKVLGENQDATRNWGDDVREIIVGVYEAFHALYDAERTFLEGLAINLNTSVQNLVVWAGRVTQILTPIIGEFTLLLDLIKSLGSAAATPEHGVSLEGADKARIGVDRTPGGGGGGGGKGGGGKSRDTAKEDLQAHISDLKLQFGEFEKEYKNSMERIRAEFKKTGDENVFNAAIKNAKEALYKQINPILDLLDKLEQQNQKDPTPFQKKYLIDEEKKRRKDIADFLLKDDEKSDKEKEESHEKYVKAIKKIDDDLWKLQMETAKSVGEYLIQQTNAAADAAIEADQRVLDNVRASRPDRQAAFDDIVQQTAKRAGILRGQEEVDFEWAKANIEREKAARKKEIEDTVKDEAEKKARLETLDNDTNIRIEEARKKHVDKLNAIDKGETVPAVQRIPGAAESGFFGGLNSGQLADLTDGVQSFADVTTTAFSAAGAAVNGLAEGFGSMLESLILMGTAGPNAVQKMTASILAGVAKQAAVLAVFHLAKAIGELFWDPPAAGADFTAAGLFASIAGVTGLAGHVVAGNAFKTQTANGGAGATSSGQQASLNSNDITNANNPQNRFTEAVHGFGEVFSRKLEQIQAQANAVMGGVEEQLNRFNNTFGIATPGHVVMAGAADAGPQLFDSMTAHLGTGAKPTEDWNRGQGRYR